MSPEKKIIGEPYIRIMIEQSSTIYNANLTRFYSVQSKYIRIVCALY